MTRLFILALLIVLLPTKVLADCNSAYDDDLDSIPWTYLQDPRYLLCYVAQYQEDSNLAETWIDNAFQIGRNKYGVIPPIQRRGFDLNITIFLVPWSTNYASSHTATVMCCWDRESLEIHIMTPSSPDYTRTEDNFIKTLTHEMMNTLHYESREPPNIKPPRWILEGLAEFEGYYNTTPANREEVSWLVDYVYKYEQDELYFGRTIESGEWTFHTSSRYRGSAIIMIFLAEQFGEGIHPQLFTGTLRTVLREYGVNRPLETFIDLGHWLERKFEALD